MCCNITHVVGGDLKTINICDAFRIRDAHVRLNVVHPLRFADEDVFGPVAEFEVDGGSRGDFLDVDVVDVAGSAIDLGVDCELRQVRPRLLELQGAVDQ